MSSPDTRDAAWRVYCGAHTHVSLISDGEQGECATEFVYTDDDPVCPSEWVPCPTCGADCEVLRTPENALDVDGDGLAVAVQNYRDRIDYMTEALDA